MLMMGDTNIFLSILTLAMRSALFLVRKFTVWKQVLVLFLLLGKCSFLF